MKSMTSEKIVNAFRQLTSFTSEDERLEYEAQELAFSFLSAIDREMAAKKISKKNLADTIGTSASYITQLFRGDRMPNFTNLAKMKNALNLEFDIKVKEPSQNGMKFQFPDIETEGYWVYKSLRSDYRMASERLDEVPYDETIAA